MKASRTLMPMRACRLVGAHVIPVFGFHRMIILLIAGSCGLIHANGQFAGGGGSSADPYLVAEASHLDAVRDYPTNHFRQIAVIDLGSYTNWMPIGTTDNPFRGTYHGGSNTIANLTINRPGEERVGLFGYITNSAWIRHLVLTNATVLGSNDVGAVAGYAETSQECRDLHVWGIVTGSGNNVGGLFGLFNGTLRDSTANVEVNGVDHVAGMVGRNMPYHSSFALDRCTVRGSVTGRDSVAGIMGVRGRGSYLINYASVEGRNTVGGVLTSTSDSTLNYAANHGTITASGNGVGGVAASMTTSGYGGSANYCYNYGDVSGSNTVGGILGSASVGLTYAYNLGAVTGHSAVGGLIGSYHRGIYSPFSAISFGHNVGAVNGMVNAHAVLGSRSSSSSTLPYPSNSYYDQQTSGVADPLAFPRTTAEMIQQITFSAWDFDTIWSIGHDGVYTYPYMQWQGTNDIPYVNLLIPFASDVYVTGTDSFGETLTGHYTYHPNSAGDPEGATTFRWLRADDQAGPFVAIPGATNQTYTLVAGDDNKWFQFEVTVRDTEGNPGAPVSAVLEFTHGKGTAADPWQIANAIQLNRLRHYLGSTHNDKHFTLIADIDLGVAPWNTGAGWEPIGHSNAQSFQGKLNGRGHVIRNLFIHRPASNYQGLFGYINGGEIVLLGLEEADVTGNRYVGALAGMLMSGHARHGYAQGHVTGTQDTGGFIGYNSGSTIQWSYSTASVTGGTSNVGGLLGFGGAYACYWDVDASGRTNSGNGAGQTGLTTEEMQEQASYAGWNFYTLWEIEEDAYPAFQDMAGRQDPQPLTLDDLEGTGTPEDPYLVGNVHELNTMRLGLSAHYRLTNDIDMADTVLWDMARGWTPVGSIANKFTGSLDGAGHVISNLAVVRIGTSYQGLFGYTENARIENLTLSRAYVIGGGNYAAALAAFASGTILRNIRIEDLYLEASAYTAGLVGYAQSGCAMEFVRVQGVIHGANYTAGLVGYVSGGTMHACEAEVMVSGATYVGGLGGYVTGGANINHCRSTGEVTGGSQVGGLIGHFTTATMSDCFSHSVVNATSNVGGLIGYMSATSTASTRARVYRSFSTGPVTGSSAVGGLVGAVNHDANNMVFNSYWDTDASGQTNSIRGSGQDTVTMQSSTGYPGYNFSTRWTIDEGNGYPQLRDMAAYSQPQAVNLAELNGDGSIANPYILLTLDHLNAIRQDLTAHYRLGAHIDATATVAWDAGRGWTPVGTSAARFSGTLDGNGQSIRNLSISRPITDYQALFAYTQNAVIHDLGLEQCEVRGNQYTGSLIAHATGTRVEFVRGTDLDVSGGSDTGGLIGYANGGQLHALFCDAITRGDTRVGGLIGNTAGNMTIYHCRTEGMVQGLNMVGGMAGQLITALMTDSYSHAIVEGGSNAGGLIGYMGASASASRARVLRSFSTGPVSGSSAVGGLVGAVNAVGHNFEAYSYWDTEASGQTNSARGTGKRTPEMQQQATFTWYNFNTLWWIDEESAYPAFRDLAAYSQPTDITLDMLGGNGSPDDPYLITTLDELNAMRHGLTNHFRLAADLDASSTVIWDGGQGWSPVGPASGAGSFRGMFDGNGHTISNLTVNRPLTDYVGLFGYLNTTAINDLKLENIHLHANNYAALLAGYGLNTLLERISTDGALLAHGSYVGGVLGWGNQAFLHRVSSEVHAIGANHVGGLAGWISSAVSAIYHSSSRGTLEGITYVAGLVGYLQGGLITDSYSRADVRGTSQVGGLVGVSGYTISGGSTDAFIYRSYSDGLVEGTGAQVGGLLGHFVRGGVEDAYWDMDTSSQTNSARGTGLTTAEMRQETSFPFFNFTTLWRIEEGVDTPGFRDLSVYAPPAPVTLDELTGDGSPGSPFLIHNLDELAAMRLGLTNHFRLVANIDASSTVIWNEGRGWAPVGTDSGASSFRGTLDGGGFSISNLVINRPRTSYAGLFGYVQSAAISNLSLSGVQICGFWGVGSLAGQAMVNTELSHCAGSGFVLARGSHVGGLAGWFSGQALDGRGNVRLRGESHIAGLFGRVSTASSTIRQSLALGEVSGADYAGGLVGYLQGGTISNCYSRVAVSGTNYVGGLVGESGYTISGGSTDGMIRQSYSAGPVTGAGVNVGGLLGRFIRGTVTNSYWDIEVSGQTNSARGEGRTTVEMTYPRDQQTTYFGWDFVDIWSEDIATLNEGYPRLLRPGEFNLIYRTGPGGWITGATVQVLLSGQDGTTVEAVPDAGAAFDQWSDGRIDNPRTDTNVTANLSVIAHFKSVSLVPIDWYDRHGIERAEGETWADVDQRFDPDKDMTLLQQFIADLDPNSFDSRFDVIKLTEGMGVHFHSSTGRLYILQGIYSVTGSVWSNVPGAGPRPGFGGADVMTDTNTTPSGMIYRINVRLP